LCSQAWFWFTGIFSVQFSFNMISVVKAIPTYVIITNKW
jgi:hypothetical protein